MLKTTLFLISVSAAAAQAASTTFTGKSLFDAAVSGGTVLDFTELTHGESRENQYAAQGLTFTPGRTLATRGDAFIDGKGFRNVPCIPAELNFASPMSFIGVEFPGGMDLTLHDGLTVVFSGQFGRVGRGFSAASC